MWKGKGWGFLPIYTKHRLVKRLLNCIIYKELLEIKKLALFQNQVREAYYFVINTVTSLT